MKAEARGRLCGVSALHFYVGFSDEFGLPGMNSKCLDQLSHPLTPDPPSPVDLGKRGMFIMAGFVHLCVLEFLLEELAFRVNASPITPPFVSDPGAITPPFNNLGSSISILTGFEKICPRSHTQC